MLGHRYEGQRRRRAPGVTQNKSGNAGGKDRPNTENRRSDGVRNRGGGLTGILTL